MAKYFIQDTRQVVGNCVLWWRAEGRGYTCDLGDAGLYDEAEAFGIERSRSTDKAIPEDVARKAALSHVHVDRLARILKAEKAA